MTPADATAVMSYAVGVTVFRPDPPLLRRLLATLRCIGVRIFVYVDGVLGEAIDAHLLDELRADPALAVLQAEKNGGIGVALNALVGTAAAAGFHRIVLFDQDSDPSIELCHKLNIALGALEAQGYRVAAIGPRAVAPAGEAIKPPRYRCRTDKFGKLGESVAVDYVITSGSLISITAWETVGAFREDYFIDGIDTEWCMRAWNKNFQIRLMPSIQLPHRLGNGIVRFGPIAFPRQSEKRMLSYVRNRTHMLRLPHVPVRRKLQTLVYLPLQALVYVMREPTGHGAAKRFVRAFRDGWQARLGPIFDR